jgi:hypothetical protein
VHCQALHFRQSRKFRRPLPENFWYDSSINTTPGPAAQAPPAAPQRQLLLLQRSAAPAAPPPAPQCQKLLHSAAAPAAPPAPQQQGQLLLPLRGAWRSAVELREAWQSLEQQCSRVWSCAADLGDDLGEVRLTSEKRDGAWSNMAEPGEVRRSLEPCSRAWSNAAAAEPGEAWRSLEQRSTACHIEYRFVTLAYNIKVCRHIVAAISLSCQVMYYVSHVLYNTLSRSHVCSRSPS